MYAIASPRAGAAMVRLLLEHGASPHQESRNFERGRSAVSLALGAGEQEKLEILLEFGADLHYCRNAGYDALIDAVHGRDLSRDTQLIGLLRLLIGHGVALNAVTTYHESGLRVLSRIGRFDAVRLLLNAGADENQLAWTPLIRAVALGSLVDVKQAVENGAALEEKDWWERTAWLVAIQSGDLAKARYLLEYGADMSAHGRCGHLPLLYAIESHYAPMLKYMLEIGMDIEQTDDFGTTALTHAVENCDGEAVDILLEAGADVNAEKDGQSALSFVRTREIAMRLLAAGADPARLPFEGRRALLGFDPDPDETLLDLTPGEFVQDRTRRFGTRNPEPMSSRYYEGMIRAGINAYQAARLFDGRAGKPVSPVWCAQRFGQSITFLPDGRVLQIAGEHEDHYDPDFCIYNDVFVHEPGGEIHIFGYPESIFPPTDFHTATRVGEYVYLIGSLGYPDARCYGMTPVYRLDIRNFRIEPLECSGVAPGWIFQHRAILTSENEIRIFGGKVLNWSDGMELCASNTKSYLLDTRRRIWREDKSMGW
jgi:ankyrin repeat protein